MAAKRSVMAVMMDFATEKGEVLHKILEGNVLDNTKNAIAAFAFKDSAGNAVFPTLNAEGAIVVSGDAGTTKRITSKTLIAAQTKDLQEKIASIVLNVGVAAIPHTKANFMASCYAEVEYEMQLIVDDGLGGEAITTLGYAVTSDVNANAKGFLQTDIIEVPAGATTAELRLMATPFEGVNQQDDMRVSMSINEIA